MRIGIIGAGMAGLTAARMLSDAGLEPTVFEKARAVGGRMASKRFGDARFDIGAQHFSVRSRAFADHVERWTDDGVVEVWYHGESITEPHRGSEPRRRGAPAMRSIPEHLAQGLDVRLSTVVDRVEVLDDTIRMVLTEGGAEVVSAVVVTAPVPQALRLARTAPIDPAALRRLSSIRYNSALVAMLAVSEPTPWNDGHLSPESGPIAWMADDYAKGVSDVPAVTVHSTAEFASEHLEEPAETWLPPLVRAAEEHLAGSVTASSGHRWRYAQPVNPVRDGAVTGHRRPPIVFAGEAFSGARVEGAFRSGLAAAEQVLTVLGPSPVHSAAASS